MNKREAKRAACRWASQVLDGVFGTGGWVDSFLAEDLDPDSPDAARFEDAVDEIVQELFERGAPGDGDLFRVRPLASPTKEEQGDTEY